MDRRGWHFFFALFLFFLAFALSSQAQLDDATKKLSHDIFKQLIEINSTDSVGSVTAAAEAMAQRFRDAGFAESDLHILGPNDRKKNLVVRFHGSGKHKPILLIGHLDVVEAHREDWTTDPFQFVEKDGFYYGRGTQDMKDGDAIMVTTLIRFKKEGYTPDRDIILALTADEEGGKSNGVDWLLKNQRALIDAEFVFNHDGGGILSEHGKPVMMTVDATEKLYADFQLSVTDAGGHSSLPTPDNAIYHIADGLIRLQHYQFPFELNDVTRAYYEGMIKVETPARAADMKGILKNPPDASAIARLSQDPIDNSTTHTTCVATRLNAGHANNALPQRAEANVNCRILPGHSAEEVRQDLIKVLADPKITVRYVDNFGNVFDSATDRKSFPPPPLSREVFAPLEKITAEMWTGTPVIPEMATGASDGVYTMSAGMPTYGIAGTADRSRRHPRPRPRREAWRRVILQRSGFLLPVSEGGNIRVARFFTQRCQLSSRAYNPHAVKTPAIRGWRTNMRTVRNPSGIVFALVAICLGMFLLILDRSAASPAPHIAAPSTSADPRLQKSYRFQQGGWTYVHLEGSPERIGFQHGYLLAREIADAFAAIKLEDTHTTQRDWEFFRKAAREMLWPKIDTEYQQELTGIVEGLKAQGVAMDIDDLVALNAFEELPGYYVPWVDQQQHLAGALRLTSPGNCSAFVATGSYTRDHQIVIAHNNWTSYLAGSRWVIVFDIVPEHGNRILMDGFPGVITSDDDFGVNSNGIMIAETTITQFVGWDPKGKPEFVRSRKALQYANSIDDYARIIKEGNNGGYANDWLIGDRKTGEIAYLELGLKHTPMWRTKDGYFISSNFARDPAVIRDETSGFDAQDASTSPNARRVRWERLMKQSKGQIDVGMAESFMADHLDSFEKKEQPNERSLCGHVDTSSRGVKIWEWGAYYPGGAVQGKATDSALAERMSFQARAGHPCGQDFIAKDFLDAHPDYSWQAPVLHDMKSGPWTLFHSGQREAQ